MSMIDIRARVEFLAAGTDLMERRRSGISPGTPSVLRPSDDHRRIVWQHDGSARIGAAVTMAAIAADTAIVRAYPGLAAASGGLATPQVRNVATIAGNIAQHNRCWYYRNPHLPCLKRGGTACPARYGNHLYGVIFDRGPCVAPHPSTIGAALLAYEAEVTTNVRPRVSIGDIFGDGSDGTADNALRDGELIEAIHLPVPVPGEQAFYDRAIARTYAEWPLVEAVVRIVREGDAVRLARIAVGGVAPVPLRLPEVERALEGRPLNEGAVAAAAKLAAAGVRPLPQTGYKVALLENLIRDLAGRA